MNTSKEESTLSTPVAIIVAGIFIALAIFLVKGKTPPPPSSIVKTNVSTTNFNKCLESGKYASRVASDMSNAVASGGQGTPWSIIVGPTGIKYPINGAYPYNMLKGIIDDALVGNSSQRAITLITDNPNSNFDLKLLEKMNPVTALDHIRGNPDAKVVMVEYSDTECPFCKVFHATMQQVMNDYGKDGRVAWVYRHFPIDSLHSKARKEAEAMECAYDQGGDEKFWSFTDRLYEVTTSNNGLDPNELYNIAKYVGLK